MAKQLHQGVHTDIGTREFSGVGYLYLFLRKRLLFAISRGRHVRHVGCVAMAQLDITLRRTGTATELGVPWFASISGRSSAS